MKKKILCLQIALHSLESKTHLCEKKIYIERHLNLPCLNSPAENKDEKGVKKWGEYFPV